MAASTLDSELFTLQDNWPGAANLQHSAIDITDSESKHNLAAAGFQVGSKLLY